MNIKEMWTSKRAERLMCNTILRVNLNLDALETPVVPAVKNLRRTEIVLVSNWNRNASQPFGSDPHTLHSANSLEEILQRLQEICEFMIIWFKWRRGCKDPFLRVWYATYKPRYRLREVIEIDHSDSHWRRLNLSQPAAITAFNNRRTHIKGLGVEAIDLIGSSFLHAGSSLQWCIIY